MSDSITNNGEELYICETAQNEDLDQSGYEALTWVKIAKVGTIGEYGKDTSVQTYNLLNGGVLKGKGVTDYGSPEIECARSLSDAGQAALRTAASETDQNAYAFKRVNPTGEIDYLRAMVTGPVRNSGGSEDFVLHTFTLGLQQAVIEVPVTSGGA